MNPDLEQERSTRYIHTFIHTHQEYWDKPWNTHIKMGKCHFKPLHSQQRVVLSCRAHKWRNNANANTWSLNSLFIYVFLGQTQMSRSMFLGQIHRAYCTRWHSCTLYFLFKTQNSVPFLFFFKQYGTLPNSLRKLDRADLVVFHVFSCILLLDCCPIGTCGDLAIAS